MIAETKYKKARFEKLKAPVLITGAAGFIGRRLLNRLLDEGVEAIGFDVVACPESLGDNEKLEWIQGSISDPVAVGRAVDQAGTVFHLAAMVGDWGEAELHQEVTVDGTFNVFQSAQANAKPPRIVLASSIVVYGDQIRNGRCHEGLNLGKTFGPYSESKQAQEKLAYQYLQRGLDIRIVRPANVYGAGSKPWVEALCEELKRGVPTLIGGGDYDAGLVHVENVVDVLIRVAKGAGLSGQIFNAADEEGITWKQYMHDIAKLCGAPKPGSIPRIVADAMALALENSFRVLRLQRRPPLTREALNLVGSEHRIDMSKSRGVLSYKPRVSYREGLAELQAYIQ